MALAASALTTYQVVKAELGLTDDSRRSVVERMISSASDAIINVALGRRFERVPGITELVAPVGKFTIVVIERWPIRSISAINLMNPDGSVMFTYDPSTYQVQNPRAGTIFRTWGAYGLTSGYAASGAAYGRDFGWPNLGQAGDDIRGTPMAGTERPGVQVCYDGGWITPQQDLAPNGVDSLGQRDLPSDLEEACIVAVESMWFRRGRNRDIQSETVANTGASVTYRQNKVPSILPPESIAVAQSYARVM